MSEFFELKDAGAVLSRSGQLGNAATELKAKLAQIQQDIAANEGPETWGNDKHGEAFRKNYGDGQNGAGADAKKSAAEMPTDLSRSSRAVTTAATSAMLTDANNKTDIERAAGD